VPDRSGSTGDTIMDSDSPIANRFFHWLGKNRFRWVAFGFLSILVGIALIPFWTAYFCSTLSLICILMGFFAIYMAIKIKSNQGEMK
jgi:hypothetical protein